jgi:hypothetical protein
MEFLITFECFKAIRHST